MKSKVLRLLSDSFYVSGESISHTLGISRAAVWKYINSLKSEGYIIESSTNKGYKILNRPDLLTYEEVSAYLKTKFIGRNLSHYNSLASTNTKAKEIGSCDFIDGTVLVSEEQLNGRGRLGRNWSSPKSKGIWMSILLKPDIPPTEAYKVTIIAAAAVYRALAESNVCSLVKWPNDIVINNKKVCGILTEMNAELSRIHYLVIGIGINVNTSEDEFPEDIREKASSLFVESGRTFDRKVIMSSILNNYEALYKDFLTSGSIAESIAICRENSAVLGREVVLIEGNNTKVVEVIDISENGHLIVKDSNETREILSGEISVRGKNGYI